MNRFIIALSICALGTGVGIGCMQPPQGRPSVMPLAKAGAERTDRAPRRLPEQNLQRADGPLAPAQDTGPHPSSLILERNFHRSDLVFIGRPIEVQPGPGFWAGGFPSHQAVRYQIIRPLKNKDLRAGAELTVLHDLVHGAPTVERDEVRLSRYLFAPGRTLLVFAQFHAGAIYCLNEADGVVEATEERLHSLPH